MSKSGHLIWLLWLLLLVGCGSQGGEKAKVESDAAAATFTSSPVIPATLAPTHTPRTEVITILTEDDRPDALRRITADWQTNWTRHTIRYDEILSGGPPRDGIPSLDEPKFVEPNAAADWLAPNEPVIAVEINDLARAYPLQILTWHEIVNDTLGDVPILITFCPLCNSAIVFDRRLEGQTYEFGTSGLLRFSDLIMYDRTSESLWQQFTGQGIVGDLAGKQLTLLPSAIISFADFQQIYPDGQVLSRDTGYNRDYGRNPYVGYDDIGQSPFLFTGIPDDRLPAMARVVTVSLPGGDVAYPYNELAVPKVVNDSRFGQDMVVFFQPGTNSALDTARIADGEDVGATGVFDPRLNGEKLTFRWDGTRIIDDQTGSHWNIAGQAETGPLTGQHLMRLVHGDHFWFSWAAFRPDTAIYQPE